jgi:hypothetical protein
MSIEVPVDHQVPLVPFRQSVSGYHVPSCAVEKSKCLDQAKEYSIWSLSRFHLRSHLNHAA